MTPTEIYNECLMTEALMTSRGFLRPEVSFFINFFGGKPYSLKVEMRTREDYSSSIADYINGETEDDLPLLFTKAREWVAGQKTPKEIRHNQFLASLGAVIDEAKALDLPMEFMNPLVESMKALSTNILEHHA